MVSKLLRPGANGVSDWMIQRISAIVLALYVIFFLSMFLFFYDKIDFLFWRNLFSCRAMQVFTLLALISLVWHAWVGMWTILTDYIRCAWLRLSLEVILIFSLFLY